MATTLQIQLRNDIAANWTLEDPTLLLGEMGVETDTYSFKIGDGTTAWTSLGYFATTHATGDGNIHVTADGGTNNGKILTASAVAGVYTWESAPVDAASDGVTYGRKDGGWTSVLPISGGTISGTLNVTGDITAYYSDDRLKTKGDNIGNALGKLKSLNGFHYSPNQTALDLGVIDEPQVGLSAQEVEKVLPSAITESTLPLKMGEDDKTEYKAVQYDQLIGLLVEAVKELKAQIAELKGK